MPLEDELNEQIIDIVKRHPNCYVTVLKSKKNRHLSDYILEATSEYTDLSFPVRIYWTLNKIHDYPRCQNPTCPAPGGKELRHDLRCHPLRGYSSKHCCSRCAILDPEVQDKMKKNSIAKCGYEHPQQDPEYRKKYSDILRALPDEHWEKAQEKREQTNLRERGVKSVSQDPEVKKKVSETCSRRTDEQKLDIAQRTGETKRERYGDDYRTIIAEKGRATRYEKNEGKWEAEDKP